MTLVSTAAKGSGSSSGGMTALANVILGADAATLDSGTFATTSTHLLVLLNLRHSTAELLNSPTILINNDAGGNYDTQRDIVSAGVASADKAAANRGLQSWGDTATANEFAPSSIFIPDYTSTTRLKNMLMLTGGFDTVGGAGASWQSFSTMNWNSTAAITRIVIAPPSGNFRAGSSITVYGLA